ncbi:MAG: hypothetical protein IJG48_02040 [Mogibacterium sp.]|jgi:hypothetical protein|nr:hypothetical protein [Mogibacterium sp.]
MKKGTFWLNENKNGGVSIGIEDYEVEAFGGCDYEWIYTFDTANTLKLIATLSANNSGSLEQMITEEFGIHLDKKSMKMWLDQNDIKYEFNSWVH